MLVASSEGSFDRLNLRAVIRVVERACRLIAGPDNKAILRNEAASPTIDLETHAQSPPQKKPLNLFSLSYWRVEREKRLNDAKPTL